MVKHMEPPMDTARSKDANQQPVGCGGDVADPSLADEVHVAGLLGRLQQRQVGHIGAEVLRLGRIPRGGGACRNHRLPRERAVADLALEVLLLQALGLGAARGVSAETVFDWCRASITLWRRMLAMATSGRR